MDQDFVEQNVQRWKVKKVIKMLDAAKGVGTSMISLIIPPKDQISRALAILIEEYKIASNVRTRVGRLSVLGAITSAQQRLKLYKEVPPNGLVLFVGTILTDEGKEKKVSIDFEPHKPINTFFYLCDNKFHTEPLSELLDSDQKFGFIIMDDDVTLFGTLTGNARKIIHKFSVDTPNRGQATSRFSDEERHGYIQKVAELAAENFIANGTVNIVGLVLAGSASPKSGLSQSGVFDQRLAAKIIGVVDTSYEGENGFDQAIELSAESIFNVKFAHERELIQKFTNEVTQDTGRYCFCIDATMKALDLGAVETLIIWEDLDVTRYILRNAAGVEVVVHRGKDRENDCEQIVDKSTGLELEQVANPVLLSEWFAEKYKEFGTSLEFISTESQEGARFVKDFGGIGGLLRYKVELANLASVDDAEDKA